ncbi:Large terminase phage packaging protein [Faunimonas pinastri]|uniref:Large terminase phage packaging protein n=1 Tax=Faunimonas pinastri TaxID=1855383 RepID=A0A1H9M997_9HYPH|nr:Large terminase phage packaging protein [Faunimonas pinastri]
MRAFVARPGWQELLAGKTDGEIEDWLFRWSLWARSDQLPPDGDWTTWMLLGGRGAGKTRAGAEWIRGMALGLPPFSAAPVGRIALVGETLGDVREVMVDGISGLLAIHPPGERPQWSTSRRRLEWPNGSIAQAFSSEDPESLRGPQFGAAWCDELAKWRYAEETWDMLQFGLRLGDRPRQVVTSTPRPIPLLKRLIEDPATVISRAGTDANREHLAAAFLTAVTERYGGTRLGRQELAGEIINDRPDALWQRDRLEALRVKSAPDLVRVVVGVDPPATSGERADACGIVAVGIAADGTGYVLADASMQGLSPAGWARRAVDLCHRLDADRIVAEVNQGGDMVEALIRQADESVSVTKVRATRGKWLRAEPVAALYEQGRMRHVGAFPALEDEMCDFSLGGLSSGRSPDRLDALVWATTSLMLGREAEVRLRRL